MAVENESGNPIMLQTIFEPKNSFGNDYCWIRGRCKNIKHSFNLSGKYEIISYVKCRYVISEISHTRKSV